MMLRLLSYPHVLIKLVKHTSCINSQYIFVKLLSYCKHIFIMIAKQICCVTPVMLAALLQEEISFRFENKLPCLYNDPYVSIHER